MSEPQLEALLERFAADALVDMTPIEREMNKAGYPANLAQECAVDHFDAAVEHIDSQFGPGYARNHPTLIGAFMQTAAAAYQSHVHIASAQEIAEAIRGTLRVPR